MKPRVGFQGWIFGGCILVVCCTLVFVAVLLERSLRQEMLDQIKTDLASKLILAGEVVSDRLDPAGNIAANDRLADELGSSTGARITIIGPHGKVMGDSEVATTEIAALENHGARPEVVEALGDGQGLSMRYSSTLDLDLLYAARLVTGRDGVRVVVRAALPLRHVEMTLARNRGLVLSAVLLGVLLSLGVTYVVSRSISRPLRSLTATACEIAEGDLSQRFRHYPNHEIGELGRAFDQMADNLQARINEVTEGKDRVEAILTVMVEGVMVTDPDGHVTLANDAFLKMMGLPADMEGRHVTGVIRNAELIEAFAKVRGGESYVAAELRTLAKPQRFLEAHLVRLPDSSGLGGGVVTVLHDLTERKRLDEMRRDFVANVSHELRTPLTSIRGSAETLLDGALENPDYARHFAEMIMRNARRLEQLAGDLLELAKLESGDASYTQSRFPAGELADSVLETMGQIAGDKELDLQLVMPSEDVYINGSRTHLEQAVLNLLDNAVKYTDAGGEVRLGISQEGEEIVISVSDSGVGIEKSHLPRIFERFYRVDKDRSRVMGGTGLGLAIVKHVAQAHGGRVEVESTPGKGSTFTLRLPA